MNRIKNYEISVLLFFLTQSQFFIYGLNSFTKESGRATIIAMILGSIIGFFLLKLTLSKKYFTLKKKSLFLLIPFLALHLSYILNQTIHFITYNVVSTISYYLLAAAFLLLVVFCVKRGLKTITRSAFIYLITSIFLFQLLFVISVHLYIFYLSFLCISHTIFHLFFRFISFFRFVIFLTFFRKIYIALFPHFIYNKSRYKISPQGPIFLREQEKSRERM